MNNDKYSWDFGLLYKSQSKIDADIEKAKQLTQKIMGYEGKLNTKQNIVDYLKDVEEISKLFNRLDLYQMLKLSKDQCDPENIKFETQIMNLLTNYSVKTAFAQSELAKNDSAFLESLMHDPELSRDYDRVFESIIKEKPHTLNKEKAEIVEAIGNFTDYRAIYDKLTDEEIKFDPIVLATGEKIELNNASYGLLLKNEDREIRRQAHENLHKGYKNFNLTLSQLYVTYLKRCDFFAKTHNHKSYFKLALFGEEVDEVVYDTLIKNIHKNINLYQKYLAKKAQILGNDEFLISDTYAPIGDCSKFSLDYDDAVKLVLDMVKVFGDKYFSVAKKNFESRWVDVFPTKGKQSGAFSASVGTGNPFMMLNYNKTYNEISTIAHELGHSMHSYFSENSQPFFKQSYVIFVAEVASTVNEILLAKKLIRELNDKDAKLCVIENLLAEFSATVFRQTMFSEFEHFAHSQINAGQPLSYEELNTTYANLQNRYFGDVVKFHEYAKFEWSRIPHFYRGFYVYKYATGFISAVSIASKIEKFGADYVNNHYLKFLSGGCSADPVSLLRLAEVDITTNETYNEAFKFFDELINLL